ncbi:MAG: hypothetical protein M5U09_18205 [Gammaproteobacteria bacterium]|nr:hypothetical protein [Gammaproteobacteria bacterium]
MPASFDHRLVDRRNKFIVEPRAEPRRSGDQRLGLLRDMQIGVEFGIVLAMAGAHPRRRIVEPLAELGLRGVDAGGLGGQRGEEGCRLQVRTRV